MKSAKRRIELLAPARNAEIAVEAIKHGADAVYIGASSFGARAAAGNSLKDISDVVDYAHQFNARVYATVNTIIYDNELRDVERLIKSLYRVGVDALIVQDMGVLRMDIPPIELHASTQCDIRTPEKAAFLESLGFSQLVLARELTLNEIRAVHDSVSIPIESFVHGALCVSYSGCCQVSETLKRRSANRGECAQICRLPFDLVDEYGNVLVANKHLLSLRDMNQSERLESMIDAGVSSFKIEGRLKDMAYVKSVVAYYRQEIDAIISANSEKYERASAGTTELLFTPNLYKSFNRSFTHYFLDDRYLGNNRQIASINTPKSQGEPVGQVTYLKGNKIKIDSNVNFNNGDGFSYLSGSGEYCGFRINRANGNELVTLSPVGIKLGTQLFRTFDNEFESLMQKNTADRRVKISAVLKYINKYLYLYLTDNDRRITAVSSVFVGDLESARTSQENNQRSVLSKLGNTIYSLGSVEIIKDLFIPSSILVQLRRNAIDKLDSVQRMCYKYGYRKEENRDAKFYTDKLLYSDNVANKYAKTVYQEHGVTSIELALEIDKNNIQRKSVMQTRYCIRRELGACHKLKQPQRQLPNNLYLKHGNGILLRVECDCRKCEMKIYVVEGAK